MIAAQDLDLTFAALADPTRRAILLRLAEGVRTVNELAEPFAISLPAVSRHLKVLEQARLITRTPDGQHRRCSLRPEALESAADWLAFHRRFWSESFDRLEEELRQSAKNKEETHGASRKTGRK
ncbi:MAG TPA: metalloregulator ArsR/SmtB family transcription factor [Dongiaceae bacterium]